MKRILLKRSSTIVHRMCVMYSKVVIAVFFRQTIVHESLLKERLDFETLENVSILPSKAGLPAFEML